jgi:hypothetical protein
MTTAASSHWAGRPPDLGSITGRPGADPTPNVGSSYARRSDASSRAARASTNSAWARAAGCKLSDTGNTAGLSACCPVIPAAAEPVGVARPAVVRATLEGTAGAGLGVRGTGLARDRVGAGGTVGTGVAAEAERVGAAVGTGGAPTTAVDRGPAYAPQAEAGVREAWVASPLAGLEAAGPSAPATCASTGTSASRQASAAAQRTRSAPYTPRRPPGIVIARPLAHTRNTTPPSGSTLHLDADDRPRQSGYSTFW